MGAYRTKYNNDTKKSYTTRIAQAISYDNFNHWFWKVYISVLFVCDLYSGEQKWHTDQDIGMKLRFSLCVFVMFENVSPSITEESKK